MKTARATKTPRPSKVVLRPLGDGELEIVSGWFAQKRNFQWLDFGGGRQMLTSLMLKVMTQRSDHWVRVYAADHRPDPVGLVGLSNVNRKFGTAEAWCVLGDKRFGRADLTIRAADAMFRHAFSEMGLGSIFAWTVEINRGGRRILERAGFRFIGRLRRFHRIGDRMYDRLLYDMLADEYDGYRELRP